MYCLSVSLFVDFSFSLSNEMNKEIFVKEKCINIVHSVAIYLTLFSFSLKVLQPLMATDRGM